VSIVGRYPVSHSDGIHELLPNFKGGIWTPESHSVCPIVFLNVHPVTNNTRIRPFLIFVGLLLISIKMGLRIDEHIRV